MKAKMMKGKLPILAITGLVAVTLTACNGYYPYDYRYEYYSPYGHQGGAGYGYRSGYYPYMYDWYSQPLYGRGNYGSYGYPDQAALQR